MVHVALGAIVIGLVPVRAGAQVRAPRDGQVSIHGRLVPPRSVDSTRIAPHVPLPDFTRRPPPAPSIGVDPGYRPLWVPGTYVWNGFSSTYMPGHYVWQTP